MSAQSEYAQLYRQLGIQVIPARRGEKTPSGPWRRWQSERYPERELRQAFEQNAEPNLFIITGAISKLAVLDCDNEEAIAYWEERLGKETLEATAQVTTSKGKHYYFRLPSGRVERGWSSQSDTIKWDIRAEGQGVVAPPSIHPSGRRYEWVKDRGPESIKPAPKGLWKGKSDTQGDDGGNTRSMLTSLLKSPATEGGRNNWLAQVAGHYATMVPYRDAFEQMVRDAAEKTVPPMDDSEGEIERLIESIWQKEQAKRGRAAPIEDEEGEVVDGEVVGEDDTIKWWRNLTEPAEETGWLVSGRTRILCQTKEKRADGIGTALKPWMDTDIRVLGVIGQGEDRMYEVELLRDGWRHGAALPAETVADPRALSKWLAGYGASIAPPDEIWPVRIGSSARLLRYLEAQQAPAMEAVEALGWHEASQSFITHEGVIRASGPGPHEGVRPLPTLKNWAPYRYGFRGREEASRVLSEILTWHDETVAAVFGSFWAASLLKPQIQRVSSQFPFMAIEATSESGKSRGMMASLMEMSGYTGGNSAITKAATRDALSAHRSGIVWMDDLDDLEPHMEMIRQATVEGVLIKKGADHQSQVSATLRAALVISGENLGLREQKALLDRAILLDVPSPIGRRSLKGDWPQWDDVLAMREQYPDFTILAGSIVEMALQYDDIVSNLKLLRVGAGRFADKNAILRLGARVLSHLLGDGDIGEKMVALTDAWVLKSEDPGQENTLTLRALPSALSRWGWPAFPQVPNPDRRRIATPVWVERERGSDVEVVWFSPKLLAAWIKDTYGRVGQRVESEEALQQQARALDLGGTRRRHRLKDELGRVADGEPKHYYWRIEGDLCRKVLERSKDGD